MWGLLAMRHTSSICIIAILLPIIFFSQSVQDKEESMYAYFNTGYNFIYVQRDSAYHYLENALTIAKEIDDYDSSIGILDHITITADYHHDLPKFRTSLQQIKGLLSEEIIANQIQDVEDWKITYLIWLASYHFETMEYVRSKELFLEARSHLDDIHPEQRTAFQDETLFTIYSSLGTTYMNLGNYELAELNYKRGIQLVKSSVTLMKNADAYVTGINQSLAQLYTRMGKHEEANLFYIKNLIWSKEYFQKDKKFKNNLVNAFHRITTSYIKQDSLEKALRTLKESESFLLANDPFRKDAFVMYGDIYTNLGNYDEALANYQKALQVLNEENKNIVNLELAEVHEKIARLFLTQDNYEEGLKTVQNAFNVSGNNVKISNTQENPDPTAVFSKTQLLNLLDAKVQLSTLAYQKTRKLEYKVYVLQTSEVILKTFDFLKREFDSKIDKKFLADKAYPIFYRTLDAVFEVSENDDSSENVDLALNIAEKNKDFMLLEALRNSQANEYGDVPREVLDKEAQLRSEITYLEKELFDSKDSKDGFSESLFKVKQQYYSFLDSVKLNYPKYHGLKYQITSIDLETVRQKILKDNGTLISFTLTDKYLYTIVVNDEIEKFLKIPFSDSDRQMIRDFYKLLSRPSVNATEKKISRLSKTLYEKLLKIPLNGVEIENITIIPDGELHYLPFDMLVKDEAYLLETANISYANSIASLFELKQKQHESKQNVLAFAPSFNGLERKTAERDFGKLLNNDEEVQQIQSYFETNIYSDSTATLENFMSFAPHQNIIHLATHASANDEFPDYSYLAFSESSNEENVLYIKDLYNMSLNADMVTLSACQTGIGKLQQGQGVMSLSKGFYYAGAKSLVNTLWKINDKSTVKLMEFFYEGLSKGNSKSEALRKAKLKYLETTDDDLLKHPYYWAAFMVSGDIDPIVNPISKWWWVFLLLPILASIWYLRKKKSV